MLKLATSEDQSAIEEFCKDSIPGTRILCYALAYGFDKSFLEMWLISDGDGLNGILARFFDDAVLLTGKDVDIEQISCFLDMLHFRSLMCSESVAKNLRFKNYTVKKGFRFCGDNAVRKTINLDEDNIEDAYKLICREIPDSFNGDRESYLSFLSDFTYRKRRELARGVCISSDSKIAAVALTSSETNNFAIISGVACDRSVQKTGLGKRTVLSLVDELLNRGKQVFVIALNKKAEGFYEHIGFTHTENIAFIEREKDV